MKLSNDFSPGANSTSRSTSLSASGPPRWKDPNRRNLCHPEPTQIVSVVLQSLNQVFSGLNCSYISLETASNRGCCCAA